MTKAKWSALLLDQRSSKENPAELQSPEDDPLRSPFEADFDRVIYSAPFRRLARKTQVHPLSLNDHVRTRLTHSLEVSCVGRTLGKRLATSLISRGHMPDNRNEGDLIWIMLAACAAHDIGNPPFGHAGEFAIREWVSKHDAEVFGRASVSFGIRADLTLFEGNAQGFRIASRPDNPNTGYLRLTVATLGAMIKYPWDSEDARAKSTGKFNVFSSELSLFECMMDEMGLANVAGNVARHPLSFLTEAADDICYRVLDLEDAVEIGVLAPERVRSIYRKLIDESGAGESLAVLRGGAIRALIDGIWAVFEREYDGIMNGDRGEDLKSGLASELGSVLEQVRELYQEVFAERSKVAAELGAYKALGRIVRALCSACADLSRQASFMECGFLSKRSLELAWSEDYVRRHEDKSYEWWLHQIMDYVSGLTDNYARQLSREIEGT